MKLTPNHTVCKALTLLIPILTIIAGCSHTIPPPNTRPQPPPQLGKTPPVIEPLSASRKELQAAESVLPVKLTIDLSPVQRAIQAAVPDQFVETNHPLAASYRWRFVREGEPKVQIQDGLVKFQAFYRGEIESTAARACRLDPLYPILEGTGRLMLQEQDQQLLVTMTDIQTTVSLNPESDIKCNMFKLPVKDQMAELIKQESLKQQVAQSIEQAGYTIPIHLVWERLNEPVPMTVASANTQLCLYGKVKEFTVGSLKGPAQHTTITGLARETPVAIYQSPCKQPSVTPVKVQIGSTADAMAEGQPYNVLLSVPIPYALLNHQLQNRLFHHEFKLDTTFKDKFLVEQVVVSDANGRVLFAINTSGDLNGTLYYWGTPQLIDEGNRIVISDLQMANETKAALDDIKVGYWQLVDDQLRDRLKRAATMDLSQRLGNMKTAMSGQRQTGGLTTDVLMGRQEAQRAYSTADALVVDILLQGTASAVGRVPVEQHARMVPIEPMPLDWEPVATTPSPSAPMPEDRP